MLIILCLKIVSLGVIVISHMLNYFNDLIHLDERVKEREKKGEREGGRSLGTVLR